jgi:uroporphyrinogen decarboxylase
VTLDAVHTYRFPEPDWWGFTPLPGLIQAMQAETRYCIRYRVGSVFETAWSLFGFERFLTELAGGSPIPGYAMERISEVHAANLERVLELAGDRIDMVYYYDDLATQIGLLMSPAMYARHVQPFHRRLIDVAHRHGKPVMVHSCGAVARLIPALIDMGVAILNPVQPLARGMDPETLAREFRGRIVFHGGIDAQRLLPQASAEEVRRQARRVAELLGPGYIRAGSHHIQADTPVGNILAMYEEP